MAIYTDTFCEDGSLHLVGGDDVSRGRVVYCYEGTWYSLCADGWDEQGNEARVVCGGLGYRYGRFNHVLLYNDTFTTCM